MLSARPRGGTAAGDWARALSAIGAVGPGSDCLPARLDALGRAHGGRVALRDPANELSYAGLAELKTRVAAWALGHRVAAGDVVCLMMPNAAAYPAIWTGLNQAGAVVALINTQLRQDALVHAIGVARSAHLIVHADLWPVVRAVADRLPPDMCCWIEGPGAGKEVGSAAFELEGCDLPAGLRQPASGDIALLIYTSGTTGWPKPARISHYRVLEWSLWFGGIMGIEAEDRLYSCLPMYHSTGGVAGLVGTLLSGGCTVLRLSFSARRFWQDVSDEDCTLFLYIGELCRYLLASPTHLQEATHRLRLACGNGLRPDIWAQFQERFRIPRILEFYASTEGNVSLYNCEGKPGAIGRVPGFLRHRFPVALFRSAPEGDALQRDTAGRCVACTPGEAGEAMGRISAQAASPGSFDGYTDPVATERRIERDVAAPGDAWFRTGDLMRQDEAGFFYFVDRLGDTFRWKGENVSAAQVSETLCAAPGVTAAVVYGVAIENADGKAGMAAVTMRGHFDPDAVHAHLAGALPAYAIPLYIRIRPALEATGTFKFAKSQLVADGYDRIDPGDRLYRLQGGTYVQVMSAEAGCDESGGRSFAAAAGHQARRWSSMA